MITKTKNVKPAIENRIDEVLSDGAKLAIVLGANSFRFGGNWAFIKKDDNEYKGKLELLSEEKPNVDVKQLGNGFIALLDRGFLTRNVNAVVPNGINKEFVDKANQRKVEEQQKYAKFIESVLTGKSKYLVNKQSYNELTIGVYCINDTNVIRLNGVDYPSYKLSLEEIVGEIRKQNAKHGRQILVKVVNDAGFGFMPLETAIQKPQALYKGLEIADSTTGIFLSLRLK